ncbi:kelch-like protein 5 [Dendronephthya gigantea]|uniref:kelch-like protein 5 n=1 Tax=Dendronephthya gigantea TaxID=151771 RepID=UPI00106CD225|nr:kelch-like protein 5 [Dendronephthya gigantea]
MENFSDATHRCEDEKNEDFKAVEPNTSTHASIFLQSLYKIYKEKQLCDVTLVVDMNEIETHRVVLAANSAYFYTMFTGDLLESTARKVVLKEVDFAALKLLVDYCYTSVIDFNTSNVESLLKTAHLLQFSNIVKGCCAYMSSQLHPTNCLGISSFAELHGCTSLRDSALTFATKHFCQVAKTDEFKLATLDQICQLLSSDTLNVPSEKDAFDIAMSWIKHDTENRRNFLSQMLAHIRLELLPPKVLVDCIEQDELIAVDSFCLQAVSQAKNSHLLPERKEQSGKKKHRIRSSEENLYIIGGEIHNYVFNTLECYDFKSDVWSSHACLNKPRDGLGATTYSGLIFAAGGCDGEVALNTMECYNPSQDSWNFVKPMSLNRHAFSLVEMGGWLYSVGGSDFFRTEYDNVERYDPVRDSWCDVMPMITKREGLQAVSIDGLLFAIGGDNGISILNTVEQYDPRIGYWTVCESMTYRRRYFAAAALRNQIVVLGGSDCDEDHNSVETYDMRMNRWLALPPLLVRRESPVAAVVEDRLFAIGGAFMNVETDSIDAYSVVDNKWEAFTPLPRAMEGMASAVL